jgi:prepilin-type N-terminal cleavage/methylation domain-containing protein
MKRLRLSRRANRYLQGCSHGFSLIEVVIAMALLGIIGITILSALSTATLALIITDQRATAESLARSQMEYVKDNSKTAYDDLLEDGHPQYPSVAPSIVPLPPGYSLVTTAVRLDPENDGTNDDDGIQLITVTITYSTLRADNAPREQTYTLEDYKTDQ